MLALEGLGAVEGLWGDGSRSALVAAWGGFEALEAVLAVAAFPAGEGGQADGTSGGAGDVVVAGGDLLAQAVLAAGVILAAAAGAR